MSNGIFLFQGLVSIIDEPNSFMLQAVYELWDMEPLSANALDIDTEPSSRFIFIGKTYFNDKDTFLLVDKHNFLL